MKEVIKMEMTSKKRKYLADLSLLFVAFVWGGGFVAVKDALNTVSPMLLMSLRFIIASVIMFIVFRKKIGKLSILDYKKGSIVGFVLFLAFAAQTYGLQYTTASKQGFLTAVYVIIVPFLYWIIYKRRPQLKVFIGSFLTIAGIGLISLQSVAAFNIGDSLTLLCALFFAMHIISIEYFTKNMNVFKLAFIQLLVASILFTILALLTEPYTIDLTRRAWSAIIYLAIFSTFACFTTQTIAQKYTTSSHASIIMSLESVFAAILGVLLLSEVMTPLMILGCLLIFIAILIVEVNFKKQETLEKNDEIENML